MEISFDYSAERKFYRLSFQPGAYESVPFVRELRFWGVDRTPCPQFSTLAVLIALKDHPIKSVIPMNVAISPPICTALMRHFNVEIHPTIYNINARSLADGERMVAPRRFGQALGDGGLEMAEILNWISLDDLKGPFGGAIRTNIDAFALSEAEKNLIVALCCGGKDVGHILLQSADASLIETLHQIGVELITHADTE